LLSFSVYIVDCFLKVRTFSEHLFYSNIRRYQSSPTFNAAIKLPICE